MSEIGNLYKELYQLINSDSTEVDKIKVRADALHRYATNRYKLNEATTNNQEIADACEEMLAILDKIREHCKKGEITVIHGMINEMNNLFTCITILERK